MDSLSEFSTIAGTIFQTIINSKLDTQLNKVYV